MGPVARLLASLVLALASLVVLGATGTPAYACRCVPADTAQSVDRADAVFTGTVADRAQEGRLETVVYTVAVDRVHKGEVDAEVTVATAGHESACGLPRLPEGERLVFFAAGATPARSTAPSDYVVNLCSGTGRTDDRELREVERLAGPPQEPTGAEPGDDAAGGTTDHTADASAGSSDPTDEGVSPWLVGGIGIGALVLAVLVGLGLRRRRTEAVSRG
jgi:hypothetical protein